jgi:glycosyltransferase involved in cell wall biosynthesis
MESTTERGNQITTDPLVSIVVITYNSSKYVLETLESAKEQTYRNIELIISDDCSTDNTVELCRNWIEENKSRFVNTELVTVEKNGGIPANCNRGVKSAEGEWIKIIAGDDALLENCIQSNIDFINNNSNARIVHSDSNTYANDFSSRSFSKKRNSSLPGFYDKYYLKDVITFCKKLNLTNENIKSSLAKIFNHDKIEANEQNRILLRYNFVNAPTIFVKKNLLNEFNGFDESIPFIEDIPMWLRITQAGIKIHYLNITTVNYRKHDNSVTGEYIANTIFNHYHLKHRLIDVKYIFQNISLIEVFFVNLEYYRLILLSKLGLNRQNLINRFIYKLTYIPSSLFDKIVFNYLQKKISNKLISR